MKQFDYKMFADFINKYAESGFSDIVNSSPYMKRLNRKLGFNQQFFFVADLIKLQILYTSPQIKDILGLNPETVDPSVLVSNTHPDDVGRLSRGFSIEVAKARELFSNKTGRVFLSSNFRKMKANGTYVQMLLQTCLFYKTAPFESVYALEVNTEVDSFRELQNGHFHWYIGDDSSVFRYPDKVLLNLGSGLTKRELEIIQLLQKGLVTNEIAELLFLSPATISTHRKNILKKSGKSNISELIFDLTLKGIL